MWHGPGVPANSEGGLRRAGPQRSKNAERVDELGAEGDEASAAAARPQHGPGVPGNEEREGEAATTHSLALASPTMPRVWTRHTQLRCG